MENVDSYYGTLNADVPHTYYIYMTYQHIAYEVCFYRTQNVFNNSESVML